MIKILLALSLVSFLGCSSSSNATTGSDAGAGGGGGGGGGGKNVVNGTLGGQSVAVADAIFYPEDPSPEADGGTLYGYQIRLTSYASACNVYLGSAEKAQSSYLKIKVRSHGAAVATGTYPVSSSSSDSGNYAEVEVKTQDATCDGSKDEATGGSVTLTTLTSTEIAGTFTVTSGNDAATGSFDVTSCISGDGGLTPGCVQ